MGKSARANKKTETELAATIFGDWEVGAMNNDQKSSKKKGRRVGNGCEGFPIIACES